MSTLTRSLVALAAFALLAACQRDAVPDSHDAASPPTPAGTPAAAAPAAATAAQDDLRPGQMPPTIAVPPAETPTPGIAAGARITYTCEDGGELDVQYSAHSARFALSDGTIVTLPRAESASKGGGDVYVGDAAALQRLGNVAQVEEQGGDKRVCAESGGNA